jgi:hypothetical protein
MNRITRRFLFLAALFAAGAAHASCKPLFDAVDRMVQQTRFAMYELDKPEQVPTGEPIVVIIDNAGYSRTDGGPWERVEIADPKRILASFGGAALRAQVAAGTAQCRAAGRATYRGAPVARFRYEHVVDKEKITGSVFVDLGSGLPVYDGTDDGLGLAVLYGDAVKVPKVNSRR